MLCNRCCTETLYGNQNYIKNRIKHRQSGTQVKPIRISTRMGPRGAKRRPTPAPPAARHTPSGGCAPSSQGKHPTPTTTDDDRRRDGPTTASADRRTEGPTVSQGCVPNRVIKTNSKLSQNLSPRLQPKQAATYGAGSLETTPGKAPDGKYTPGLWNCALPETTTGKAPNALRINAVF